MRAATVHLWYSYSRSAQSASTHFLPSTPQAGAQSKIVLLLHQQGQEILCCCPQRRMLLHQRHFTALSPTSPSSICISPVSREAFKVRCRQSWVVVMAGYDALGFISCTGTNFMVRAAALREVGGSPTYTLTEDFALGMRLKMFGWHCRYVQEYLAIGEAPDQIRNCYQQRSRWCKVSSAAIFCSDPKMHNSSQNTKGKNPHCLMQSLKSCGQAKSWCRLVPGHANPPDKQRCFSSSASSLLHISAHSCIHQVPACCSQR